LLSAGGLEATLGASILLIDDSATTRSILKVYLTGLDVSYLEAHDGDVALALLGANRVSLIICDVNMPGMDGLTLVRKIRTSEVPWLKVVPIIVLTGDKTEETRNAGYAAGANAFVRKPVTSEELRGAVLEWVPAARPKEGGAAKVLPFRAAR
jgi:two-component system chemotaxis response regulator CheY